MEGVTILTAEDEYDNLTKDLDDKTLSNDQRNKNKDLIGKCTSGIIKVNPKTGAIKIENTETGEVEIVSDDSTTGGFQFSSSSVISRSELFEKAFKEMEKDNDIACCIVLALYKWAESKGEQGADILELIKYQMGYDTLTSLYLILQPYKEKGIIYINEEQYNDFINFYQNKENSSKDYDGEDKYSEEENENDMTFTDAVEKYNQLLNNRNPKEITKPLVNNKKNTHMLKLLYDKNIDIIPKLLKENNSDESYILFICEIEVRIMAYTRYALSVKGNENYYSTCFNLNEPFFLVSGKEISEIILVSFVHTAFVSDIISRGSKNVQIKIDEEFVPRYNKHHKKEKIGGLFN